MKSFAYDPYIPADKIKARSIPRFAVLSELFHAKSRRSCPKNIRKQSFRDSEPQSFKRRWGLSRLRLSRASLNTSMPLGLWGFRASRALFRQRLLLRVRFEFFPICSPSFFRSEVASLCEGFPPRASH